MSPLDRLGVGFLVVALCVCVAFAAAAVVRALHNLDDILDDALDGGLDVIDDAMRDPDDFDDFDDRAYLTPGEPT